MNDSKIQPVKYDESKELERLRRLELKYENLIKNGLICSCCGGAGVVGSPPDDYYDCPECIKLENKIKAEAVREAMPHILSIADPFFSNEMDETVACEGDIKDAFKYYANKLEKGE